MSELKHAIEKAQGRGQAVLVLGSRRQPETLNSELQTLAGKKPLWLDARRGEDWLEALPAQIEGEDILHLSIAAIPSDRALAAVMALVADEVNPTDRQPLPPKTLVVVSSEADRPSELTDGLEKHFSIVVGAAQ